MQFCLLSSHDDLELLSPPSFSPPTDDYDGYDDDDDEMAVIMIFAVVIAIWPDGHWSLSPLLSATTSWYF